MSFSAKIVLGDYVKADGFSQVYLQAIIDRQRATIPLGFYVRPADFEKRKQRMRPGSMNAKDYDTEFMQAIAKANTIASKFRQDGQLLTPEAFKNEYTDPTEAMDLIKFMVRELELKKPQLSHNTYKGHTTVINKLRAFRKVILFNQVNVELVQKFRNSLVDDGNGGATIEKVVKILKHYLNEARKKGIAVRNVEIKIKSFRSNRSALTEDEVNRIAAYYESAECPRHHKKLLRYFLFSCYTGLRISDVNAITWANIGKDMLTYTPVKTKKKLQAVNVPLLGIDKKYLPEFTTENAHVFETFADQVNNRYLKVIARHLGIKKKVTYHTSRHTFGSFMAEGGDVVALQKMMGHSDIKTSMGYVHTNVKQLVDAKKARFERG